MDITREHDSSPIDLSYYVVQECFASCHGHTTELTNFFFKQAVSPGTRGVGLSEMVQYIFQSNADLWISKAALDLSLQTLLMHYTHSDTSYSDFTGNTDGPTSKPHENLSDVRNSKITIRLPNMKGRRFCPRRARRRRAKRERTNERTRKQTARTYEIHQTSTFRTIVQQQQPPRSRATRNVRARRLQTARGRRDPCNIRNSAARLGGTESRRQKRTFGPPAGESTASTASALYARARAIMPRGEKGDGKQKQR